MTSPLDTLLNADGARQIFDRLAQLESAPAQTLDARSYEVDDRLLNTEPMFGQDGASASGLARLGGGLPHSAPAALDYGLNGLAPGALPAEFNAAALNGALNRGSGPALDHARSGTGMGGGAAASLPAVNVPGAGAVVHNSLEALQISRGGDAHTGGGNHPGGGTVSNLTQVVNEITNNYDNGTSTPGRDGQDGHGHDGNDGHSHDGTDGHGRDGLPGLPGIPGLPGVSGRDGRDGRDGHDGHNGHDGHDGHNGHNGHDGGNCDDHGHGHGHGGHHGGGNGGGHGGYGGGGDCGCDDPLNNGGNLITQIIDHTAAAVTSIWPGVDTSVSTIIAGVDHTIAQTGDSVTQIWSGLDNSVATIVSGVDTTIGTVVGGLNETLATVTAAVPTIGETVTTVLGDTTVIVNQSILQPVLATTETLLQPITAGAPGLLEQVAATVGSTINETLPGIVGNSLTQITQAGESNLLVQVVATADTAVNDTMPELVNTLLASLQGESGSLNLEPAIGQISSQLPALEPAVDQVVASAAPVLDQFGFGQALTLDLSFDLDHNPATPLATVLAETAGTVATVPILDIVIEPMAHNIAPVADQLAGAIVDQNPLPLAVQVMADPGVPIAHGSIDLTALADTSRTTLMDFVNDTSPSVVAMHDIAVHVYTGAVAATPIIVAIVPVGTADLSVIASPTAPAESGVHLDSHVIAAVATAPASLGELALSTIGASGSGMTGAATLDTAAHGITSTVAHGADGSWLTAGSNGSHASVVAPVAEPIHIDTSHSAHHWL